MQLQTDADLSAVPTGLPGPLDCETAALLRGFLLPLFEKAESWAALELALVAKGYGLGFCEGHLVIRHEDGHALCTGRSLGVPLADLVTRLGRPAIRVSANGMTGELA